VRVGACHIAAFFGIIAYITEEVTMKTIAKRVLLFLAVNFCVVMTISLLLKFFNIQPYLSHKGLQYNTLIVYCLIWGMTGSLISLALSRKMAKWLMGVHLIDPAHAAGPEQELVTLVHGCARRAGLSVMPEVGVYDSFEINAFATGPSSSRSLVAVSSGLLRRMSGIELEGVIAHEIAHIQSGDMVTMTLLQGIVNAFVMFFARIVAFAVSTAMRDKNSSETAPSASYSIMVFLFEIIFMILGSIVVASYSRFREYRADSGGARIAGRSKMIAALRALEKTQQVHDKQAEQPAFQAMKISSTTPILHLFATHPPLQSRIQRLEHQG
jgi:heat shock protein HtpX